MYAEFVCMCLKIRALSHLIYNYISVTTAETETEK